MTSAASNGRPSLFQEHFKAQPFDFQDGAGGLFTVGYRMNLMPAFMPGIPMEGASALFLAYFIGLMVSPLFLPAILVGTMLAYLSGRQLSHLPQAYVRGGFGCWLELDETKMAELARRAVAARKHIEVTFNNLDPKVRHKSRLVALSLGKYLEHLGAECVLVSGEQLGVNLEGLANRYEDVAGPRDDAERALENGEIDAIIYTYDPASGLLAYIAERFGTSLTVYTTARELTYINDDTRYGDKLSLGEFGKDSIVTPCIVKDASHDQIYNLLDQGRRGIIFFVFQDEKVLVPHWTKVKRISMRKGKLKPEQRPQLIFSVIEAQAEGK